ncbi:MAG: ribulose-phosphate 3-epimerase [Thermoleophilia bacterium]|nr:ribulose-phosphate 3-epimerase [Thermoleophilia bacterium]
MGWGGWVRGVEIEPSLYAADLARLGEEIGRQLDAGARVFHFDVGDGHFVEPITVGPIVLEAIAPLVHDRGGRLDCHLMVENPARHIPQIARAGGDSVTFHVEVGDTPALVALAREQGLGAGLAFNPGTAAAEAARAADGVDLVLCMSIWPGYSGQAFMPEALDRVREVRGLLPGRVRVQVDGGVGPDNVAALREAGADLLVAGSAIFAADDPGVAYRRLAAAVAP